MRDEYHRYWPHHNADSWCDAPPWAADLREMLRIVIIAQGVSMSQAEDLNNVVTSLATAFEAEHTAVVAELDALAAALAAAKVTDPALSEAVANTIANVTLITGKMATDAAALTASVPAATTVPPPVVTEPPTTPTTTTEEVPVIATPEVTAPDATPPNTPPADASSNG